MLNLISSPVGGGAGSTSVLTISIDRLKYPDASRFATKSESPVSVVHLPSTTTSLPTCFNSVSHSIGGNAAADLVEHVDRPGLSLAQLLDQHDALLQLGAALLELLHLHDDRPEPRGLLLRGRDLGIELGGFAA